MNGILVVDKPRDWTSHDVVDFVRKRYHLRKVGHAGTLDPIATGVLVLLLGKGTKLSERFRNDDKDYHGTLILGMETDTGDVQGKVISTQSVPDLTSEQILCVFEKFKGEQKQIPHPVSAVKHKGIRLYKLARRGIIIKPEPRTIFIHKLNLIKLDLPRLWFEVGCSKGTYIRTLVVDIARSLGTCAYVESLRRIRSGPFVEDDCLSIDELKSINLEQIRLKSRQLMEKAGITIL